MNLIRLVLTLLIAPVCLLGHDTLAALYERFVMLVSRNMLGYGIGTAFASWALVLLFPITSWLGDMWWKDHRRYLFNALLSISLTVFLLPGWTIHPYRMVLFLACCWSTIPWRWLMDRKTITR